MNVELGTLNGLEQVAATAQSRLARLGIGMYRKVSSCGDTNFLVHNNFYLQMTLISINKARLSQSGRNPLAIFRPACHSPTAQT